MSVSSRSILTLNSKKGCKDDEDFLELQTVTRFMESAAGQFLQNPPGLLNFEA
jgi:hypothetical protein